jgi:hypothetical protein
MNYLETIVKIFTTPVTFAIEYRWLLEFTFVYSLGLSIIFCLIDSLYLITEKLIKNQPEDQSLKFPIEDIEQAVFCLVKSYRSILRFNTHSNLIIIARPDDRDRLIVDFYSDFLDAMRSGSVREIHRALLELMSAKWFIPIKGDVGYVRLFIPSLFKGYIQLDTAASLLDIIRGYKDDYIKIMKFLESVDDVMMRDFVKSMHLIYINKGICRSSEFQDNAIATIAKFLIDYLDKIVVNDIKKLNADDIINLAKAGAWFSNLYFAASSYVDKDETMKIPVVLSQVFPDNRINRTAEFLKDQSFIGSVKKTLLDKIDEHKSALQALTGHNAYNVSKITLPHILVAGWGSSSWAYVPSNYEHKTLRREEVI